MTEIICYPINKEQTEYEIPDGVTSIGNFAFECCKGLVSIKIPNSVTSIGGWAFNLCESLVSVTIPGSVKSIEYGAFSNCYSLTSITIGSGVTSIGDYAFEYCESLVSVTIPDSVTSIESGAFSDCESLVSVTIPGSITSIGGWAFNLCESLTDVYYGGSEYNWKKISIDSGNECLTNAAIHYSAIEEAEIVNCGEFDEGIAWTLDEDGILTLTAEESLSAYTLILAGYGADGNILRSIAASEGVKMSVDGIKKVKIFIWESMYSMKPVCEANVIELN